MRVIRKLSQPVTLDFPLWLVAVWTGYALITLFDLIARMVP